MNEELMNNLEEVTETIETEGKGGILGKIVVGVAGTAIVGGIIYAAPKVKSKMVERKIKSLEKAGYIVYKAEEVEEAEFIEEDFENEE